jgi:hypothetical protein
MDFAGIAREFTCACQGIHGGDEAQEKFTGYDK